MENLSEDHRPKGTVVLIYIFFVTFLLVYLLNWKYVTDLWKVG